MMINKIFAAAAVFMATFSIYVSGQTTSKRSMSMTLKDNAPVNMSIVEQKPMFPGGEAAMYKWIYNQLQYPAVAFEEGVQGRVVVQFIVEENGAISHVNVVRGKHPDLDAEALRVVKKMPKWNPGRNNGQPVRVIYNLPVTFKFPENGSPRISFPPFSRFAKDYVEERINRWQIKGEFEKTINYRQRIETQRNAKITEYTDEARNKYILDYQPKNLKAELSLSNYDADAEIYIVSHPRFGDFVLPVCIDDAPAFKESWLYLQVDAMYAIENDSIAIQKISFKTLNGKAKQPLYNHYIGTRTNATEYTETQIDYNFDPIEIDIENPLPTPLSGKAVKKTQQANVPSKSDIDTNVPTGNKTSNSNTFAVVIANENYRRVSSVEYAHNDGDIMRRYLVETLGLPENQVHYVKDATLNDMRGEIEWLKEIGDAYNGNASFIFYYAGHGIPDESTSNGYMLPVDGYGSMASSGLAINELNEKIAAIPSKLSLVILDACFSGAMRGDDMLASVRGVAIKVRPGAVRSGNVVVITASQNDETASKSDEYCHGLFTYFLLKKIQESKGSVRLKDLADYTIDQVRKYSLINSRKSQTPSVLASPMLKDSWGDIILTEMTK